jgi:hypothetical protein
VGNRENLIPFSNDASDVVADAAIGICSSRRREFLAVGKELTGGNIAGDEFDRRLRSSALGKVAAARAEMNRRQMIQKQAPQAEPPPAQQKTKPASERGI